MSQDYSAEHVKQILRDLFFYMELTCKNKKKKKHIFMKCLS